MKRVLLYILLSVSLAVFAQQQSDQEVSAEREDKPAEAVTPKDATQPADDQPLEESGETGSSDKDFKPSEEISEDYPVPLPSDI
jgi:hypothetical protein